MCDVCVATEALKKRGGAKVVWSDDKAVMRFQGRGRGPECEPATYRVRVGSGKWSRWAKTDDLAGVAGAFGFDVKWPYVGETTKKLVAGKIDVDEAVRQVQERREMFARRWAEKAVFYTVFTKGRTYLTTSPYPTARYVRRLWLSPPAKMLRGGTPEERALVQERRGRPWTEMEIEEALRWLTV